MKKKTHFYIAINEHYSKVTSYALYGSIFQVIHSVSFGKTIWPKRTQKCFMDMTCFVHNIIQTRVSNKTSTAPLTRHLRLVSLCLRMVDYTGNFMTKLLHSILSKTLRLCPTSANITITDIFNVHFELYQNMSTFTINYRQSTLMRHWFRLSPHPDPSPLCT